MPFMPGMNYKIEKNNWNYSNLLILASRHSIKLINFCFEERKLIINSYAAAMFWRGRENVMSAIYYSV
jgi:hypothetical protein